jgi:hypothetical protein
MAEIDFTAPPPPACPVCGAPTRLKQRYKNPRFDGDTCVFKCTSCAVEYPTHVDNAAPGQSRPSA